MLYQQAQYDTEIPEAVKYTYATNGTEIPERCYPRQEISLSSNKSGKGRVKSPESKISRKAPKEQSSLIAELDEILESRHELESEEGIILKESSVQYASLFINIFIIPKKLPNPHIEIHSDGEIAFTWRKQGRGIMNIAFNENGVATWAAYIEIKQQSTSKGRFHVQDLIPDNAKSDNEKMFNYYINIKCIIQLITANP